MKQHWREISIIVPQTVADTLSDKLIEFGSQGTVFEDYPEFHEMCKILAYYPETPEVEKLIQQIQAYLDELEQLDSSLGKAELTSRTMEDVDWSSNWKQYFKPLRVGQHLLIKPSWETYASRPNDVVIELDPGMAFGTGLHASTRLVLRLLENYVRPNSTFLDVGVGSGILSIAAARLGADYVLGIDIDAEAVAIARDNVRQNSLAFPQTPPLENRIELVTGSLDTLEISREFDAILMNIRPHIILPLLPYAASYLQTGGALILSGILEEEGPDFLVQLRANDFLVQHHLVEDGWIAYVVSHMSSE